MVHVGNCCFIVPLKSAVMMIGLICMMLSFIGLLLSTSSVLSYLRHPTDPLLRWLLKVCYIVGENHGIAFHAILLIVSTLLACAVVSNVSRLLVPWIAVFPIFLTAIIIQMIMVIIKEPDVSMPIICFSLLLLIFYTYATLVVGAYYREVTRAMVRIRVFNLHSGELPRTMVVPQRFAGPFFSQRRFSETSDPIPAQALYDNPTENSETRATSNWTNLRQAYARFMQVMPHRSQRTRQLATVETRF